MLSLFVIRRRGSFILWAKVALRGEHQSLDIILLDHVKTIESLEGKRHDQDD